MLTRIGISSCVALKMVMFATVLVIPGSCVAGCLEKSVIDHGEGKKMTTKTIEEVLKNHTDKWMSIPGVVGTAIGQYKGKPCIKILVAKKTDELRKKIPSQVEGFAVVIEKTGEIRALRSSP